ncbi:MAG: hypothetical protein V3R80_14465 [Candidatus Tectomicrobia bacterium]
MGEKSPDFLGPHVFRMTSVVKDDKASDPTDIGFFSADIHVLKPDGITYLIEQCCFWHHMLSYAILAMKVTRALRR